MNLTKGRQPIKQVGDLNLEANCVTKLSLSQNSKYDFLLKKGGIFARTNLRNRNRL